jgi:hypothetical protein
MRFISALFLSIFLLIPATQVFAQGEATVLFMLINAGARQGGMGEAGVADPSDATAVYWNPAGLAFENNTFGKPAQGEATLMHVNWLPSFNLSDLYYDFAAAKYTLEGIGTVGLGIQFMNYGDNNQTDVNGNFIGTFSSNEFAFTGSYGVKVKENLGVGVNLKFIYSRLSPVKVDTEQGKGVGSTFAVDIGTLYHPGFAKKLSIGANLANFGPKITYIDKAQADPIPTNLRLGIAYRLLDSEFNKLTILYDVNRLLVPRDEEDRKKSVVAYLFNSWGGGDFFNRFTHSVGLEYWYTNLIALRTGYFYEDPNYGNRKFATFGGGVRISFLGIDFSYILGSADDSPLADTIRFSLSAIF